MIHALHVEWHGLSVAVALSLALGCQQKAAAVAPPPPPPPNSASEPPPPLPPPKCESLSESCAATDATVLGIGEQGTNIAPPAGWNYAKESGRSLAVGADGKSLLAVAEIASGNEAAVLDSLQALTRVSGIDKVKFDALKRRLKKPQITVDANGVPVDLWEISKSTSNGVNPELREQGPGTLLVFVAHFAADRVVTGLGFVVVPDAEAEADKVMHAVQSLKSK